MAKILLTDPSGHLYLVSEEEAEKLRLPEAEAKALIAVTENARQQLLSKDITVGKADLIAHLERLLQTEYS